MRSSFYKTDDLRSNELYLKLIKTVPASKKRAWPAEYLFFIHRASDNAKVGHCAFRIGHTQMSFFGGNIGYEVYPLFRGNHYAAKACGILYELARLHGMAYLYITCNPENTASRRSCELAGGRLIVTVDLPVDSWLYKEGDRRKCIYRVDLISSFEDYMEY